MKKIKLNLLLTEGIHESGVKILSPLNASSMVGINNTPRQLGKRVYNAIHEQLLKKGQYSPLLEYIARFDLQHEVLEVSIEASKDKLYPELILPFDLFYFENEHKQWIGFVPVLIVQSAGNTLEELRSTAIDNVRLEFMRNKRLNSIPAILETIWYKEIKTHKSANDFDFYTLSEIEQLQKEKDKNILPQVAQRMLVYDKELFGLNGELEQLLDSMKGRYRSSVLVIGNSGTGKTALIKEFNRLRTEHGLESISVWEITASQLIHRLTGMGSWEEKMADVCNELRKSGDILYINNFSELFEIGQYVGNNMSVGDFLRDYIARGETTIISECTPEEASQIELNSPGYIALFNTIRIEEMADAQIQQIVIERTNQIAAKKNSLIETDAIKEILRLQQWYTPYSGLPGKTINFLDAVISDKQKKDMKMITRKEIYERFCQETGMPEFMVNAEIPLNFEAMQQFFHENIYGQEDAIHIVLDVLVSIKAAVIRRGKPLASLLFVGPTGVGKTEMAKVLAEFMFGNRGKMIRFDMSEYADPYAVMHLTGDLTSAEGLLTSAVRQNPFSVILLDELEKVHYSFYDLLLQILGEGRLTDKRGRVADFCSTIIIMTSNIGARSYQMGSIGFTESNDKKTTAVSHFKKEVQDHFRPELFNRLDRVIPFAPLDKVIVRQIVDREISIIRKWEGIRSRNISFEVSKEVLGYFGEAGFNIAYGARFLQRTLLEKLIIPLSIQLNGYEFSTPLEVKVSLKNEAVSIKITKKEDVSIATQQITGVANVSVLSFINEVTKARREAIYIEQGSYYAKFLSRSEQLERKLKKLKGKRKEAEFWQNEKQSKEYYLYLELSDKYANLFKDIQSIETDNFLVLNGVSADVTELYQRYKTWAKAYEVLKENLVQIENPEFMTCVMGIYGGANGNDLPHLLKIYKKIALELSLKYKVFNAWHWHKEDKYMRTAYDSPEKIPDDYTLIGLEIEFSGNLPQLQLKDESGMHIWVNDDGINTKYIVMVQPDNIVKYKTPIGVHRKNFFDKQKERRTYINHGLKDKIYQIELANDIEEELIKILKQRFRTHIDSYLLG